MMDRLRAKRIAMSPRRRNNTKYRLLRRQVNSWWMRTRDLRANVCLVSGSSITVICSILLIAAFWGNVAKGQDSYRIPTERYGDVPLPVEQRFGDVNMRFGDLNTAVKLLEQNIIGLKDEIGDLKKRQESMMETMMDKQGTTQIIGIILSLLFSGNVTIAGYKLKREIDREKAH